MDELIDQLRCIVAALRTQNAFNEKWMAQQKEWREEDERVVEQRYQEKIDLDRQAFMYQQKCHEEAERLNEQRYQEHSAREDKIAMAAIDYYTRQDREP